MGYTDVSTWSRPRISVITLNSLRRSRETYCDHHDSSSDSCGMASQKRLREADAYAMSYIAVDRPIVHTSTHVWRYIRVGVPSAYPNRLLLSLLICVQQFLTCSRGQRCMAHFDICAVDAEVDCESQAINCATILPKRRLPPVLWHCLHIMSPNFYRQEAD